MSELAGSLTNFEIAPLVRFLCSLGKSGDLLMSRDGWIGQLSIDHGNLIACAADQEVGRSALEFIAAVMTRGDFEFSEGPPTMSANLQPGSDPLAMLDRLTAAGAQLWIDRLLPPTTVPRVADSSALDDSQVTLPRLALFILRDIDGASTVRDIAQRRGLVPTLKALGRLQEIELITFDADRPRTSRPSEPPPPPSAHPPAPPQTARFATDTSTSSGLMDRVRTWRANTTPPRLSAVAVELGRALAVTGIFVVALRGTLGTFRVDGVSMQPTFQSGQALIVNRVSYFHVEGSPLANLVPTANQASVDYVFGGPQRGDVVVFRAPPQPDLDYIKRIIGLPGESVLVQQGRVYINGQLLTQNFGEIPADYEFPSNGQPVTIPDASYFVLGDNRPDSFDSHTGWVVPASYLIGRVWLRYWPPSSLGIVQPAPTAIAAAPNQ